MEDRFSLSSTEREESVRSRNSNWRKWCEPYSAIVECQGILLGFYNSESVL